MTWEHVCPTSCWGKCYFHQNNNLSWQLRPCDLPEEHQFTKEDYNDHCNRYKHDRSASVCFRCHHPIRDGGVPQIVLTNDLISAIQVRLEKV